MKIFNYKILNKLPKIGMRSIKTFIATLVAILVSKILNFSSPFFTTLSAFMCIQGSIVETSQTAIKRGIGTLAGGVFSLIYLVFMPNNIYLIPLGLFVIIYLFNLLDKTNLISPASVVFLAISSKVNTTESFDPKTYVISRVWETFIGILIAIIINNCIAPPNPFKKLRILDNEMSEFVSENAMVKQNIALKNLEQFNLKLHEFSSLIKAYNKEKNNHKKYNLNMEHYNRNLDLFKHAYNHFSILATMTEGTDEKIFNYHVSMLKSIKDELKINTLA